MIKKISTILLVVSTIMFSKITFSQDLSSLLNANNNQTPATKLMSKIEEDLKHNFSEKDKVNIFQNVFKNYTTGNWYFEKIFGNDFLENSKFENEKNGYAEYIFSYDERSINITLKHYKEAKQLVVGLREFLPLTVEQSKEIYANLKKDRELKYEYNAYALFSRKDHADFQLIHVSGDKAIVSYQTFFVIDLEK